MIELEVSAGRCTFQSQQVQKKTFFVIDRINTETKTFSSMSFLMGYRYKHHSCRVFLRRKKKSKFFTTALCILNVSFNCSLDC